MGSACRSAVILVALGKCNLWLRINVCVGVEDRGYMVAPLAQRVHRELGVTQWPVPDGIEGRCTKDSGTEDLIGVVGEGPHRAAVHRARGLRRARLCPRVGRDRLRSPAH